MSPTPSHAANALEAQPPLDCRIVMSELWDYLDGELPEPRLNEIREHLATCTGCSSHVEFCRSFLAQIQTAPVPPEEVAALRSRVQRALRQSV